MMTFDPLVGLRRRVGLAFLRAGSLDIQIRSCSGGRLWRQEAIGAGAMPSDGQALKAMPRVMAWVLVIPGYLSTTRYTRVPSTDPREIGQMLDHLLPTMAPCTTEQWTWGFSCIHRGEDGSSDLLVALSPLAAVEDALERLSTYKVHPRMVMTTAQYYAGLVAGPDPAAVVGSGLHVCLTDDALDFFVLKAGRCVFFRGIRLGECVKDRSTEIQQEVRRTLCLCQDRGLADCTSRVVALGPTEGVQEFTAILSGVLPGAIEARTWESLYGNGLALGDRVLPKAGHAWPAAHDGPINLLPPAVKARLDRQTRVRQALMRVSRVVLVVLLALVCVKVATARRHRVLEAYQLRLTAIRPEAESLQSLRKQLDTIRNQIENRVPVLDVLSELYRVLPADVTVHDVSMERDKQIVIRAQAKVLSQAFDCIGPLEQSRYFGNVRPSYANQRQVEGNVLIDFELVADLSASQSPSQEAAKP